MIRLASYLLTATAAGSGIWFTVLYLSGSPELVRQERLGLAPLMAGLGAAILQAWDRGRISRFVAMPAMCGIVAWVLFLTLRI